MPERHRLPAEALPTRRASGDFPQRLLERRAMPARLFIDTSGWNYQNWSGRIVYPAEMKP